MTRQELFDRISRHLLTQKKKAECNINEGKRGSPPSWSCRYRAPGGLSCAVGCIIPDELYTEALEGRGVTTLVERAVVMKDGTNRRHSLDVMQTVLTAEQADFFYSLKDHRDFLSTMQRTHDVYAYPDWWQHLRTTAFQERLDNSVLNEFVDG
jgi:hypothetical protein